MGKHTAYTRRWLDRRFGRGDEAQPYFAHQPIYGFGHPSCEPNHARRFARTFQILRQLARLEFETLLDVGGAEGFLAARARDLLGCRALSCDLSVEASRRAWELFELDSIAASSHALPFFDGAFDVVLCSEVVEHVEFGIETLLELQRVARVAVVLTTEECTTDRAEIEAELFRRCGIPHHERNLFHPDDLRVLFGDGIELRSQFVAPSPADGAGTDEVRAWIVSATSGDGLADGGVGVVLTSVSDRGAIRAEPRVGDEALLDALLEPALEPAPLRARPREDALGGLAARAVCPACGGALAGPPLVCRGCGVEYPVDDGVADFASVPDPTREGTAARLRAALPATRAEAALALRDALDLPLDSERREWDFRRLDDRCGWLPSAHLEAADPSGRVGWALTSTGETPWLISPGLGIRGADIEAVEVTMRIHNPEYPVDAGEAQLFWMTEDDDDFAADRHAILRVVNDGELHDYRFELRGAAGWPTDRDLVCLRFDPVNGPCAIELVALRLVR